MAEAMPRYKSDLGPLKTIPKQNPASFFLSYASFVADTPNFFESQKEARYCEGHTGSPAVAVTYLELVSSTRYFPINLSKVRSLHACDQNHGSKEWALSD